MFDLELGREFEIYVRLTNTPAFRKQLEQWLFRSMELFFPKYLASTIIVFDSEKEADWVYAHELVAKYKNFNLRICYMNPVPEDVVHGWSKERMYLDMMHADACKPKGYVGFVDVDTLFVTEDLLFEDGKPIVTGRIGIPRVPCWIQTAVYVLGLRQVMQCMSYFPVVFNVEHIVEMRRYVEKMHRKSFMQVFKMASHDLHISGWCYCHYSMMCNYVWYFHRDQYAWHLQVVPFGNWDGRGAIPSMVSVDYFKNDVLPSEKIPIPRSSIHARHFIQNGIYMDGVEAPNLYVKKLLKEGLCYSYGHQLCPQDCKEFDVERLQDSLFSLKTTDGNGIQDVKRARKDIMRW